ncbi:MAG: CGNR zinc finger domain-containing protein [Actinomycetota bacterium]|nr:CGNR zinc finger domain-containing protein [Actinomycetota bacterium]
MLLAEQGSSALRKVTMPKPAHTAIPSHPSDHACVDFVDSSFSDHLGRRDPVERIDSPQWQKWFLDRYGLKPVPREAPPIEKLVVLRQDIRRILVKWSNDAVAPRDLRLLDRRVREATFRHRVAASASGVRLAPEPLQRDWTWVMAMVAASCVALMETGDPKRLKLCGNTDCSWMFYDTTVNRSKQFCSTTTCASLVRVRRFRQRG